MNDEKISTYQLTMIAAGLFLGSTIAVNGAQTFGPDAWYGTLVSIAAGLVLAGITALLSILHPGKAMVGILIDCFGKTAGKILAFGYMLLSLWLTSVVVLNFSFYNNTTNYPETPLPFISICYLIVIAYVVKKGLEVMGRISEVLTILIFLITFITFATLLTDFHPDAFLPMFKNGILSVTLLGLQATMLPYAEIFLVLNIIPAVNDPKKITRSVLFSILVAGLLFFIITLRNISVLGVELAARNIYPSAKVFRLMPGLNVIPLLDVNVIVAGVLKVSVSLYSQVKILADIFEIKDYKLLVFPSAMLDIAVSTILHHDIMSMLFSDAKIVPLVYIPVLVILPIIMLIVSLFQGNRTVQKAAAPPQ